MVLPLGWVFSPQVRYDGFPNQTVTLEILSDQLLTPPFWKLETTFLTSFFKRISFLKALSPLFFPFNKKGGKICFLSFHLVQHIMQMRGVYVRGWPGATSPLAPAVISFHLPAPAGRDLLRWLRDLAASQELPQPGGDSGSAPGPGPASPGDSRDRGTAGTPARTLRSIPASRTSPLGARSAATGEASRFSRKWQKRTFPAP